MKVIAKSALGMLLAVTAALAHAATTYTYDELNRLTKVVYDDGRSISYTYDAAGNLTQREAKSNLPELGLVGHWSFDNCDARDSSPNANHGALTGAPACAAGRFGSALRFNGNSDWITVPNSASFPKNAITISYWLNREDHAVGSTLQNYIFKELAFQSSLMTDNSLTAGLWLGDAWNEYGRATALLPTTSGWAHYAFTFDNATRRARAYVDGVSVVDTVDPDSRAIVRASAYPLYLGRNGSANVHHIMGLMDDVRIYDRALTSDEITLLNNDPAPVLNPGNGHSYEVINCGTWTNCRTAARARGGELVTVRSKAESDWLIANMLPRAKNEYGLWIGLTDEVQEGVWRWTSGEPLVFTNWRTGEPNNRWLDGRPETYVHMWKGNAIPTFSPGVWNDIINEPILPSGGSSIVTQAIVEYLR